MFKQLQLTAIIKRWLTSSTPWGWLEERVTRLPEKIRVFLQIRGGGGQESSIVKDFFVRHSGAGQPSVRSGNRMVAKGKTKETCL